MNDHRLPGVSERIRNVDAFVVILRPDGHVVDANPKALELAGVQPGDIIGQAFADCTWFVGTTRAQERAAEAVARATAGSTVRREIDLGSVNDRRIAYEFTFVPELGADGAVQSIIVSGIDVAIREQTDSEKNLRFLNELGEATRELHNPARIMEVTARMLGRHMRASRAAYADVEDDNDRFTIQHDYTDNCPSTVGNYQLEVFGERAVSTMRGGRTLVLRDVDTELTPETGLDAFHAIGITAIVCCPLIKYGNLVAMMAVHQVEPRDWTAQEIALVQEVVERSWSTIERARAQHRLAQKERQFEDLFEFAPDALVMADVEGRITLVNQRAEVLFGYSRPEMTGQNLDMLVPGILRANGNRLQDEFASLSQHGPYLVRDPQLRGRNKDGGEFPIEVSLSPMETEQGPVIAASVRDNTERNRLESQLQQSLKMETVGQLAGGVAHDFNNLLTVINATVELLMDRVEPANSMRQELGTILRAGEQAASLTRQLLALSRQQVLNPTIVDLNSVLKDMEPMLQRLIGENIAVKFRPASDPTTTKVDRTQVDQVLLNLALNSRDAMPDGGTLILETSIAELDAAWIGNDSDLKPGPHAVLTVSDTGTGMDEGTRRKVFEPFFTTKPPGKGTGLGLSTVYGIVQQSGGLIRVHSEPGKGTTFHVYLPLVRVENRKNKEMVETARRGDETILVIEDESEIRQVARIMLERRGYRVLVAESGDAALQMIKEHGSNIDLVLSDVVMPGSNGPEVIRAIRESLPDIRVLYMSGYAADLIARHGVDDAPHHFIAKPFTLAELSRAVRDALDS